ATNTTTIRIPLPSATPTRAFVPASVPTATPALPTQTPVITASNACKNILYPARAGSKWTYFVSSPKRSGNVSMSVISVQGQQATVDAVNAGGDANVRTQVLCDQDIILNFPLLSAQKLIGDMINGTMNMEYVSGVLAPNEAAFTASNWALSWIIQYRISGSGIVNFRGRDFSTEIAP